MEHGRSVGRGRSVGLVLRGVLRGLPPSERPIGAHLIGIGGSERASQPGCPYLRIDHGTKIVSVEGTESTLDREHSLAPSPMIVEPLGLFDMSCTDRIMKA